MSMWHRSPGMLERVYIHFRTRQRRAAAHRHAPNQDRAQVVFLLLMTVLGGGRAFPSPCTTRDRYCGSSSRSSSPEVFFSRWIEKAGRNFLEQHDLLPTHRISCVFTRRKRHTGHTHECMQRASTSVQAVFPTRVSQREGTLAVSTR